MYYLILALVLIVAYVFLFFAAKNWHWLDITTLALMLPALLLFFTLSIMLLATYDVHRSTYETTKTQLEDALRKNELLRYGNTISAKGELEQSDKWLTQVREELGRTLYDRGRVWPNCFRGEFDGTILTVMTAQWGDEQCSGADLPPVATDIADEEGAVVEDQPNVRPHGIEEKTVLYLFAQTRLSDLEQPVLDAILAGTIDVDQIVARGQVCAVPSLYLGEYIVTGQQAEGISLRPTIPLSEAQLAVLNAPQSNWTLFELMPVDSHEAFEGLSEENKGALLSEQVVSEYIRNGQIADRDSDPPERTMVRIQFKETYNQIVVDAPDEPPYLPSRDFNTLGQALPAWLRHGGEGDTAGRVQFNVGDIALFDAVTAQELITQGIAEEVERIYIRQLRDYEFLFHKMYRQLTIVEDKIAVTTQDIARLEAATSKTLELVSYREDEVAKLRDDKTGFEHERQEITRYHEALDGQYRATLQQLSTLYRESLALAEQINAESQFVEEIVNARTRGLGAPLQP